MRRNTPVAAVLCMLVVAGVGCSDSSDSKSAASTVPAPSEPTSSTITDDTEPPAADVDPCKLLTSDELETQATVAHVTSFRVTGQEPSGPDARGAVSCENAFTVINEEEGGSSEISALVAIEVLPQDAVDEYDRLLQSSGDAEQVESLGDKAFWSADQSEMVILVGSRLAKIDVGMPGILEETNRPVADAVAPIVVGRL